MATIRRNMGHLRSGPRQLRGGARLFAHMATTSWLFVSFGEHQVMAQLIATRVLMSPLIHKDFREC